MEKTIMFGLFAVGGLALFFGIEWLFLAFILLILGVLIAEKTAKSDSGPSAFAGQAAQQPIVIQATNQSPAHQLYTALVSNVVEQAMVDKSTQKHAGDIGAKIDARMDKLEGKLDRTFHKVDKKFKRNWIMQQSN